MARKFLFKAEVTAQRPDPLADAQPEKRQGALDRRAWCQTTNLGLPQGPRQRRFSGVLFMQSHWWTRELCLQRVVQIDLVVLCVDSGDSSGRQ